MRLELKGICKSFPGVRANDNVDLRVQAGEIHAVLGENGAGKSTLMNIINGAYAPDAGQMFWEGRPVTIQSPGRAQSLGIAMVHQHFALFEALTVAENIALGLPGRMNLAKLSAQIVDVSERYGLPLVPDRHVYSMSVGERQRVEIIRGLLLKPGLLIMDEPTSVLTPQAVQALFKTLRQLAEQGCSIIYISHKLEEVRALCQRATVLRQGRQVAELDPREASTREMAQLMIGGDLPQVQARVASRGEPALVLRHLQRPRPSPFGTALLNVSLQVRAGEIVGIAGVSGNGQQELLRAISGETPGAVNEPKDAVQLLGRPVNRLDAGRRRALGLGFVPDERLGRGAVPSMSLAENAALTGWRDGLVTPFRMLDRSRCVEFAQRCIERFDVRGRGPATPAQSLSGGNLQKFVVGREIMLKPVVMVLSQPTWGLDVGAASAIRQQIRDLADSGVAVLLVSEELEELFELCDAIAVIYRGHLSEQLAVSATSAQQIGLWMAGLWPGGPQDATAAGDSGPAAAAVS